MARIVIDIPDEEYETLSKLSEKEKINELSYYERVIAQGTVIPKGHGDLIDREVAKEEMREAMCGTGYQHIPLSVLNSEFLTPTVIEADKENEND